MSKIHIDVVIDVAYGDCGKGKITHHLATENKSYTHVMRTSGGQNAGHTIYHKGKKYATHIVPSGVFHGITSVIGSGCVFHPESLLKEIKEIESQGDVEVLKYLKIAKNCHIVTNEHLAEEAKESKIGTTKRGIGPAYRDKYARTGIRAEEALKGTVLEPCLIDLYEEFYVKDAANFKRILVEGAQGFYLDIDWGDYPFVTSSHCGLGGVFLNGFTHKQIDTVYGAIKAYETYVGSKQFEDTSNPLFAKIRELGAERGVTCMPKGELVLTSRGYIAVENVKIGDKVITHTGKVRSVADTSKHEKSKIYQVTLENGLKLKTNDKHPYCSGNDKWIRADKLKIGDIIKCHSSDLEKWKKIEEENFSIYEISSWGRVYNIKTQKMLKPSKKGKWGHLKVTLHETINRKKIKKDFPVHRLVIKYFGKNISNFETLEVRHLNGIAWDNNIKNLILGTPKENRKDAVLHGSMSRRRPGSHGGFKTTKLNEKIVQYIRSLPRVIDNKNQSTSISDKELAKRFKVSRELIRDIRTNKAWKPEDPNMLVEKLVKFTYSKVSKIEILEEEQEVFGLTVEEDESHVTGGIVTHNTGRSRQVNWINIDELKKACEMNAVDVLVVSKMDILKGLQEWHVRNSSGEVTSFKTEEEFKGYIQNSLKGVEIKWSYSPEKI